MAELQYRYPGLEPFSTHQEALFFGRSADRDALYELVELHQQVLLYAKSGLGKSSLINAGLVPKLLQENAKRSQGVHIIPVRIGAWVNAQSTSPLEAVLEALKAAPPLSGGLPEQPFYLERIVSDESSLWWRFKEDAARHAANPVYYLLFDQFEELFSHPEADVYAFKMQLADLLYRVVPQHLRFILEMKQGQNPDILSPDELHDLYEPLRIKVLYAIREDRYSELNQLTDMLPDFFQHRFQLDALGRAQAREAVVAPAALAGDFLTEPFEYAPDALAKILDYLTSSTQKTVETTQLQILCSHIERLRKPLVTIDDVPEFDNIFLQFYLDSMAELDEGLRDRAREFIEDYMIIDGHRIAHHRLACLEWMPMSAIDILLKERHLFRAERSSTGETLEIAHDTLVAPILIAKKQREAELEQMARAEAIAYELEERERTEKAQREAVEREAAEARREAAMAKLEAEAARLLADSNDRLRELERQKLNAQLEREQLERENQEKLLAKEQAAREKDQRRLMWSRIYVGIAMVAVFTSVGLSALSYRWYQDAKAAKSLAAAESAKMERLFNAISFYEDSLALATDGIKFGFIDRQGEVTIKFIFDNAEGFAEPGYATVVRDTHAYLLDMGGQEFLLSESPGKEGDSAKAISMSLPTRDPLLWRNILRNTRLQVLLVPNVFGRNAAASGFPEGIGSLTLLEGLDIGHNNLQTLTNDIGSLANLERLDISHNGLSNLPSSLYHLKNLTFLDAEQNLIGALDEQIGALQNLHALYLGDNQLKSLPERFDSLQGLTRLDLQNNAFQEFPAVICKLLRLRMLDLSGNKGVDILISKELSALDALTTLRLQDCASLRCAKDMEPMDRLVSLDLSGTPVKNLPLQEKWPKLLQLDLHNTGVRGLLPAISNYSTLLTLELGANDIEHLSLDFEKLSLLRNLGLSGNQLQVIPKEIARLRSLTDLDLSGNHLQGLPEELAGLIYLKRLNLAHNPIRTLPKSMVNFFYLTDLDLTDSQLQDFPEQLTQINSLRTLRLGNNPCTDTQKKREGIRAKFTNAKSRCNVLFD